MSKEKKIAARQSRNPNSGFLLDRRSGREKKDKSSNARAAKGDLSNIEVQNDVRPLSVDAFIEVLNRYCRRFLRDQKNFSLASLRILEYDRVKATAGDELADQLDRLGASLVSSSLRAEDRICFVAPSQYLVLMPGTIYDDAYNAMHRAAAFIGEKSLRHKNQIIRASAEFLVASSSQPSSSSSSPADGSSAGVSVEPAVVSTESLLNCVGYALGSHGKLIDRKAGVGTVSSAHCTIFAGSRESWLERYEIAGDRITDRWSDSASEVQLRVWDARLNGTDCSVGNYAMLARLRALQSIEHPAFNKITDFYVDSDWTTSLISARLDGLELTVCQAGTQKQLAKIFAGNAESVVLNWAMQICNAFIAAQAMSPPMVLRSFSNLKVTLTQNDRLVMCDYEQEYLRQSQFSESPAGKTDNFIPEIAQFLLQLLDVKSSSGHSEATEFVGVLNALATREAAAEITSLYKLRSTLKSIAEAIE